MPTITESIAHIKHDVSTTEGGFNSESSGGNLHFGYHKSGLPQRPTMKFTGITIPAGATIDSASIECDVFGVSGAGTFGATIRVLDKDGRWDPVGPVGDQWLDSVGDDNWRVDLFDGVTSLGEIGTAAQARTGSTNHTGDNGTALQRFFQIVTTTGAGTIDSVNVALGGSFSPGVGDIWVELWSVSGGLPDTLLATSDTRDITDVVAKIWAEVRPEYTFDFTGGEEYAVGSGVDLAVVLRGDFTGNGVHLGTWRWDVDGFGAYGSGVGFDEQNYIAVDDFYDIASHGGTVGWTVPIGIGTLTTPSLVSIIQAWVDDGAYTGDVDGVIGFQFTPTSGTGANFISQYGAAGPPPELTVTYTVTLTTLTHTRLESAEVFGSHQVDPELVHTVQNEATAFGAHTVDPELLHTVQIESSDFGAHTVDPDLIHTLLVSALVFGSHNLSAIDYRPPLTRVSTDTIVAARTTTTPGATVVTTTTPSSRVSTDTVPSSRTTTANQATRESDND